MDAMSKEVVMLIVRTCGGCIAMVLIWRLVLAALAAGIDGVVFFSGVAAIAGLGGYEIKGVAEAIRSKVAKGSQK